MKLDFLLLGSFFSFIAGVLHLAIIVGGPSWYRAFGAGEAMASMAQAGLLKPTLITSFIAAILLCWGLLRFIWSWGFTQTPTNKSGACRYHNDLFSARTGGFIGHLLP